jgi:hypothetical protein
VRKDPLGASSGSRLGGAEWEAPYSDSVLHGGHSAPLLAWWLAQVPVPRAGSEHDLWAGHRPRCC